MKNCPSKTTLKLLTIGNSFSDDAMEYVASICLDLGLKNIELGNLYIGGCSLKMHYENILNDEANYEYRINNGDGFKTTFNYKLKDAIKANSWDYICLQQASYHSGINNTYEPYLTELINFIKENAPQAKIIWHMTWAYQKDSTHPDFYLYNNNQNTMYQAIIKTVKEIICNNSNINMVIPVGTSIQNVRESIIGDKLTRDGFHLSYDLGRVIASLTFVYKLTNLDIDKVNCSLLGKYKEIVIESVKKAINNPFQISK